MRRRDLSRCGIRRRDKSRRFTWLPTAILLLIATPTLAQSDQKLLDINLAPVTLKPRSFAPMQVDANIDWKGSGIITGRLRLVFQDRAQTLAIVESQPLSLITGRQTVRLTLPPMAGGYNGFQCRVDIAFITNDRRIRLSSSVILLPGTGERVMTIGALRPELARRDSLGDLLQSLRLEDHKPKTHDIIDLTTALARITPDTLPITAEGLCAFDLLVIDAETTADLNTRQRGAIEDWIAAGGSVCVIGDTPDWFGPAPVIELRRSGLGHLATVPAEGVNAQSPEWRDTIAFLWKMTHDQRKHFVETGIWRADLEILSPMRQHHQDRYRDRIDSGDEVRPVLTLQQLGMPGAEQLLPLLMPASVRMLPFASVVLILCLFTLAIGPGDFFLLGAIRRRRWTWLLFPLLAIGFAAFTVYTSNRYMGSTDHRISLVIIDLDDEGRVLRENRFEMIFAGSQQRLDTHADSSLITAINHTRLGSRYNQYAYYGYNHSNDIQESLPPIYAGRIPVDYEVVQTIRQWQPQLNRQITISPRDDAPRIAIFDDFSLDTLGGELTWELYPNLRLDAHVLLYHMDHVVALRRSDQPFRDRLNQRGHHVNPWQPWGQSFEVRHQLLSQLNARQPEGLFSLVSQLSPAGGETFEDLTLLDPTDPNQWLLVAVYEDGDDIHVVRRVFHKDPDPQPQRDESSPISNP